MTGPTRLLRGYLVLVFLANAGGLVVLLMQLDELLVRYPRLTSIGVALLLAAGLASIGSVALIWAGRRSGVVAITLAYAVMLAVNLDYQAPPAHVALGPIGLLLLWILVWADRRRFAPPADRG